MKVEQKYTYTQEVQGVRKKGYKGRVEIYPRKKGYEGRVEIYTFKRFKGLERRVMKVEQKYTYTQEVQWVRKKGYESRVEIYIHPRGKVEQKYTYIQEVRQSRNIPTFKRFKR